MNPGAQERPLLVAPASLVCGPVSGGITTRRGFPAATAPGPSDPSRRAGRNLLARLIGQDPDRMAWAQQVHGDRVRTVHVGGPAGEADALVSAEAGLTLLIAVADCGPVLLHDATRRIIGAAHAGWRGCVAGICERTVEAMVRLGAEPAGIRAWVGPCIGPEHFEVGEEVAAQFSAAHVRRGGGRPHVDLPAAITARLVDAGLDQDRIQRANQCTFTLAERYWSYRRDGGICGRQFAWIRRAADGR